MPFTLNPRVVAMLDALPEGRERNFLMELMKYEVKVHSGEKTEKRYKEDLLSLVEKYAMKEAKRK